MKMRSAFGLCVLLLSACTPEASDPNVASRIQAANDELLNKGNIAVARDLFAPAYVVHTTGGDLRGGPEAIERFVTELRAAFPDLRVEVEILATEGDRVAPDF